MTVKIEDVEVVHLHIADPNISIFDGSYDICLVVIRTDTGIVGIGETESLPSAVRAIVDGPTAHSHAQALRDVLIGQDPCEPEERWAEMYRATDFIGRRGLVMHALGGIDLALWDIKGQVEGKPVSELLGRVHHDRIPVYGTIYPMERTADAVRGQIAAARELNLRAFKFCADPWWMEDLSHTATLLSAARDEAGPDAKLIVDAALSYATADEGLRLLPMLEEAGIWFLEAPLPLDDVPGHARMAGRGIPLGVGDLGLTHVNEFIEMMDVGLADICQPDITCVGGFTGMGKIAAAARERGKPVIPHGYKTNVEIAANTHFLAAQPETEVIMEYSLSRSPLRWETTAEALPVEPDGTVVVPRRPGLGVTLNDETVERYRWPRA
jgi:L-alanine-DL-glutamate epimerase-like enolase superfamily enzyme